LELLVVCTIIAIIASLSFSTYARMQARAKDTSCVSNLRQIASCLVLYAGENNGYYPTGTTPASDGSGSVMWTKALGPYLPQQGTTETARENKIFVCPAADYKPYRVQELARTYAITPALLGPSTSGTLGATADTPRLATTIAAPNSTIIIVEAKQDGTTQASRSAFNYTAQISADISADKPQNTKYFDFRHFSKMNTVYGDMSIRQVELADIKATSMTRNRWLGTE
jgi:type II secretory pathway pseudopilin PulG